jgi:peptidoglycan-associated lipoprotein
MVSLARTLRFGLGLVALLALGGCAMFATDDSKGAGAASSTGKSSVDALKRGEGTGTPDSSPLKEVYFNYNRADIRPDGRATLKSDAAWLKSNPAVRVQIEGHCDERGTTDYNMALGAKRAQAVKDYLVSMGIPAARLSTISYGKEAPVCKESTESCWQRNRRGRFVITAGAPGS